MSSSKRGMAWTGSFVVLTCLEREFVITADQYASPYSCSARISVASLLDDALPRLFPDQSLAGCSPVQGRVVEHEHDPVRGGVHVRLDGVGAFLDGGAEARQAVLSAQAEAE